MSSSNSLLYWQQQQASIQGMMLNPEAEELHHYEQKQIISCLPNLSGNDVLEIGAGIGRFTTYFASEANSVTAVDFNQNFISKNQEINAEFTNIIYQCDNAVNLSFAQDKFDFVFINWLFMYLEDDQVEIVINRITQWLKPKGHFFFRESCITDSKGNPPLKSTASDAQHSHFHSYYRDPQFYLALLDKNFDLVFQGNIKVYEEKYNNPNQLFWLFKKK